jgi:hypothetical protein
MVYFFPLGPRLRALLRLPSYRALLGYEFSRARNIRFMTDVMDSPAWQELMGPPSRECKRIGLQFCSDGFQAYTNKNCPKSLKPWCMMVLSLPPALRTRSEFMLLSMLMPANVKNYGQKKYFDFVSEFELQQLWHVGVSGVKVKVFASSMDTPGRADLLGT